MADELEQETWVKMGVAGALEQEYLKDQQHFLELLARAMQSALPEQTQLKTRGFLKKTLCGLVLDFGDMRYMFDKPEHGPVIAAKTKVVRGIALKTEELPVGEALAEVGEALEHRAAKSGEARQALANALGLNNF